VGGVTVQQYQQRWNALLLILHLAYLKLLFKEAAKYRKKQDLLYLIASLEEDVMTAINPPKQNTSGQFEVNFDGFTASAPLKIRSKIKVLTQSIVRARAAF
jgi:hypothetical protein